MGLMWNEEEDYLLKIRELKQQVEDLIKEQEELDDIISNKNSEIDSLEESNSDLEIDLNELSVEKVSWIKELLNATNRITFLEEENARLQVLYDEQEMRLENES